MRFCNVTNNTMHNVSRWERERKCCNITEITQRIEWPSPTRFYTCKLILSLRFVTIITSVHDGDFSVLSVWILFGAEMHSDDMLYYLVFQLARIEHLLWLHSHVLSVCRLHSGVAGSLSLVVPFCVLFLRVIVPGM